MANSIPVTDEGKPEEKKVERVDSKQTKKIREVMKSGEFSIGKLARELKWPFQKVRRHVLSIVKKENKKLTSISRGLWIME